MPYTNRFIPTDHLIAQLNPVIAAVHDPAVLVSYAGFLSVSAITVYELAVKDIFIDFSTKKNRVFGVFTEKHFSKIKGKIKIDDLRGLHIRPFGEKYFNRFDANLDAREATSIAGAHISIKNQYNNLIQCRHQFVHAGAPTLTVNEVIAAYIDGKEVLHALNFAMYR